MILSRGPRGRKEARAGHPQLRRWRRRVRDAQPALNEGRQMLALPLVQRGLVIGMVCLESRQGPTREAEVRLAFSLTQPAAIAVENARLFDEVQRLAT